MMVKIPSTSARTAATMAGQTIGPARAEEISYAGNLLHITARTAAGHQLVCECGPAEIQVSIGDDILATWSSANSLLLRGNVKRTYIMTARRMNSGEILKYRNGFFIRQDYEVRFRHSSRFALTVP